jgi:YD repeat-containing protein
MKKSLLALLLVAAVCSLIPACHKPDIPHKKLCQVNTIIDSTATFGQKYRFLYNEKRLMDSMSIGATFTPVANLRIKIDYDYLNRPAYLNINNVNFYRYVYQQGRIVRIEERGPDNQYHPFYTYLLDTRGRIIERTTNGGELIRWEYEGNSYSFKRRLLFNSNDHTNPSLIYEYRYDNKINPWLTWPNTALMPFYQPLTDIYQVFEPIPHNNAVYESTTGHLADGSLFKYREIFSTYQYDDAYPVKRVVQYVMHDPFGGTQESRGSSYYTYDCAGDLH